MLTLPVKLKYFTLDVVEGMYEIKNNVTGVVEFKDPDLAMSYDRALGMDSTMERANQYFEKNNEGWKHLDGIDIDEESEPDPLANMLMPHSVGGSGSH